MNSKDTDDTIREIIAEHRWTREETLAWCAKHGKNPALFVEPEPPQNPPPGLMDRLWGEEVQS